MKCLLIIFGLIVNSFISFGQKPIYHWNFDNNAPLNDVVSKQQIDTSRYHTKIAIEKGVIGRAIRPLNDNYLIPLNVLNRSINGNMMSVEFLFSGSKFMFTTFPKPNFRIAFDQDFLQVINTVKVNNKEENENWIVNLRGGGILSYNYLADGEWHLFSLSINGISGEYKVWIDGLTDSLFFRRGRPFSKFNFDLGDGFKFADRLDEIIIYDTIMSGALNRLHILDVKAGKPLEFDVKLKDVEMKANVSNENDKKLDFFEFAPGYPAYSVQAYDQLVRFPDPRFKMGVSLHRNFPWLDISYLHRELNTNGGVGFGKIKPARAIQIETEMYKRWNYFYEIRVLRRDSIAANQAYSDAGSLEGALLQYAKSKPSIKTAAVIMEGQVKPIHAGYESETPYILSQDLPDLYYIKNSSGKLVRWEEKKWLSPLAPMDYVVKDALTSAFYLQQVERYLGRPIDMLNENGEVYGHMRPKELFQQDPKVAILAKKMGLNNKDLNGWFQNRIDSTYKNVVLKNLNWKETEFTFYNVSAYNSNYWPSYEFRNRLNDFDDGQRRSTPSFYPAFPWNWRLASGSYNGYGTIAEGRKVEIAMGEPLFSPFVCAGWGLEENNIRPAQWLGLLKSMVMLGADCFHVGYFNVTGTSGWPNGKGPNDPRGYIYQVAMPSYAQAIASRAYDFIRMGKLLDPIYAGKKREEEYRFRASKNSHLVMVRKLGNRYLIFGSIQPNSNVVGNAPIEDSTEIKLEGQLLKFRIRRQGSMYIWERHHEGSDLFYQLDGWHDAVHPYYWSDSITIEAENADSLSEGVKLITEHKGNARDFVEFITYACVTKTDKIEFYLPLMLGKSYQGFIRVKNRSSNGSAQVKFNYRGTERIIQINKTNWNYLPIGDFSETVQDFKSILKIGVTVGRVDFDKIIFVPKN